MKYRKRQTEINGMCLYGEIVLRRIFNLFAGRAKSVNYRVILKYN